MDAAASAAGVGTNLLWPPPVQPESSLAHPLLSCRTCPHARHDQIIGVGDCRAIRCYLGPVSAFPRTVVPRARRSRTNCAYPLVAVLEDHERPPSLLLRTRCPMLPGLSLLDSARITARERSARFRDWLCFTSTQEGMAVRDRVAEAMSARGYGDVEVFGVRLALEEALVNAVKHGNQNDPTKWVWASWHVDPRRVLVAIEDQGDGFDPRAIPASLVRSTLFFASLSMSSAWKPRLRASSCHS